MFGVLVRHKGVWMITKSEAIAMLLMGIGLYVATEVMIWLMTK